MADYERIMHGLGRLLDQRRLRNVCVTEVPTGLVVIGQPADAPAGDIAPLVSVQVTFDELERLAPERIVPAPPAAPPPPAPAAPSEPPWRRFLGRPRL